MMRPFGFFVHHQGAGHATRCAQIVAALPAERPVTIFTARPNKLAALSARADIVEIPSLFEASGATPPALDAWPTPATLHCAPLGWPGVAQAVATIARWLAEAQPALFVVDVSAEIAQLARIASTPVVKIVQSGERDDPGHLAAYDCCVGLLAPFHRDLDEAERPAWMTARLHYAPGLGAPASWPSRAEARRRLGLDVRRALVLSISGAGGEGAALAPLSVGARAEPDAQWIAIGDTRADWHATPPGNLATLGWRADAPLWIAAADVVVGATGNSVVNAVLAAGRPFVTVPEWRYFDEQRAKARALRKAGAAVALDAWPASVRAWREALAAARGLDPLRQRALAPAGGAASAAGWLETLSARLWTDDPATLRPERIAAQ